MDHRMVVMVKMEVIYQMLLTVNTISRIIMVKMEGNLTVHTVSRMIMLMILLLQEFRMVTLKMETSMVVELILVKYIVGQALILCIHKQTLMECQPNTQGEMAIKHLLSNPNHSILIIQGIILESRIISKSRTLTSRLVLKALLLT